MVSLNEIQKMFRGELRLSEPLAHHTSFRIGGPADYYLEPHGKDEFLRLVSYFRDRDFPFTILGDASNVLVSDQGYRGAVINLETSLARMFMDGPHVYAEAGVKIARLVDFCIHRSLRGMERLAGIPGTLGGGQILSMVIPAEHLVEVEVLQHGELVKIKKNEAVSRYRHPYASTDVMVAARFSLPAGEKEKLIRSHREWLVRHNQTQPVNIPNAGSIFKDPPGHSAATLIEDAGMKGLRHGGAMVSTKHANVIVNAGGASAQDVLVIIKKIQQAVQEKFSVILEPEVTLIGFDQMILREVA